MTQAQYIARLDKADSDARRMIEAANGDPAKMIEAQSEHARRMIEAQGEYTAGLIATLQTEMIQLRAEIKRLLALLEAHLGIPGTEKVV